MRHTASFSVIQWEAYFEEGNEQRRNENSMVFSVFSK
jgi:hypothetical protein